MLAEASTISKDRFQKWANFFRFLKFSQVVGLVLVVVTPPPRGTMVNLHMVLHGIVGYCMVLHGIVWCRIVCNVHGLVWHLHMVLCGMCNFFMAPRGWVSPCFYACFFFIRTEIRIAVQITFRIAIRTEVRSDGPRSGSQSR